MDHYKLILIGAALHLPIIAAALMVSSQLAWSRELSVVAPLHRQMHWLYGVHIFLCLTAFTLLSFFYASDLASSTPLARAICGFIAVFWSVRLCAQPVLQVASFLDSELKRLGYIALSFNFAALVALYAYLAVF